MKEDDEGQSSSIAEIRDDENHTERKSRRKRGNRYILLWLIFFITELLYS